MTARLAIDIGGTFTDFVLSTAAGATHRLKLPSTPHDFADAIGRGLDQLLAMAGVSAPALTEVRHATTVASNAVLEGKGGRTGLITTRGFRDILEIRTLRMPRLYDLAWEKPPVLVERALRREVDERLDAHGQIRTPLDEASAIAALRALVAEDVQAIAVSLLHAYANDVHERRLAELAAIHAPGIHVSSQRRCAARDPGIRAHVDDRHQRLSAAGGQRLSRSAAWHAAPARQRGAAARHAVERAG